MAIKKTRIIAVRSVSQKLKMPVSIIQDLSGPKIRIGDFYTERVNLKKGSIFTLTTSQCVGDESMAFVNYKKLPKEVKSGNIILLDDGKKKLQVISVSKDKIKCRVLVGGETKGRRGVNIPGAYLKISSLTEKDKKDLTFGIREDVDFVALSFVRQPSDVLELRDILNKAKSKANIIAKIETQEAIENLDAIIEATDAVMVARGDLAVEMPPEDVPTLQKIIVKKCNKAGKPVIVATQMLESMIKSPVPTRAEVSDVANSILDGADAVMLSEETALGENPVDVINIMSSVAIKTEANYPKRDIMLDEAHPHHNVVDSITGSIVKTAHDIDAKIIIALTESGFTPKMISRHKPSQPIVVLTPNQKTASKVMLSFGCYPFVSKPFDDINEVIGHAREFAIKQKYAKRGDKIVIAAGVPFGHIGGTNMVMVQVV
ncbi:pyruvate kinase [Candidatus Azambacteria bacterium]|nr:pyruvate kinase [Candidatus Azambacteria bacterium]